MTPLRQEFISSLRVRNYSPAAIRPYTLCVAQFAGFFGKCQSVLGPKEIKQYLRYLIDEKKCSWSMPDRPAEDAPRLVAIRVAVSNIPFGEGDSLKNGRAASWRHFNLTTSARSGRI